MKARLVALLALFFISAQFFAAAHSATYGKADHVHDGQPCITASIVKKSSDMDVGETPEFSACEHASWVEPLLVKQAPSSPAPRSDTIRGPPARA